MFAVICLYFLVTSSLHMFSLPKVVTAWKIVVSGKHTAEAKRPQTPVPKVYSKRPFFEPLKKGRWAIKTENEDILRFKGTGPKTTNVGPQNQWRRPQRNTPQKPKVHHKKAINAETLAA